MLWLQTQVYPLPTKYYINYADDFAALEVNYGISNTTVLEIP